mmetsp:Transcript_22446/g.46772  ORF Transcript_22446/g.46772 Transcript_22446/m.46772 type:complete len:307 (-) Transcript_22446:158-1078(-)
MSCTFGLMRSPITCRPWDIRERAVTAIMVMNRQQLPTMTPFGPPPCMSWEKIFCDFTPSIGPPCSWRPICPYRNDCLPTDGGPRMDKKISKSLGNVIDPVDLVEKYGVDQTRFFLMADVGFGNDGDYSDRNMVLRVNSNLANELGNLCQRTLSMVFKNCNKAVPEIVGEFTDEDKAVLAAARGLREQAAPHIAKQAIHRYVQVMIDMISETNKYIDEQAPWSLRKTDPARADTVLYVILEVLRHVAILYQPVIPTSANMILDQLTVPADERTFAHLTDEYQVKPGTPIAKPQGIFPRLELPEEVVA